MIKALEKKKKYLIIWGIVCLLTALAGVLCPVEQKRSQGLEGANQANLRSFTEELTEGRILQFRVTPPSETAKEIGFFFRTDGQDFQEGNLRLTALDQNEVIGGREYPLKELTEDQFLFVELPYAPEELTVYVTCDAPEGPSLWLNEGSRTPGEAALDGKELDKSLIYNLTYTVQVHQYQKPVLFGLLLFLLGAGVYSAGGFICSEKKKKAENCGICLPTGKQLLGLAGAVLLTALAFFYLYDTKIRIAQNTTEKAAVLETDGNVLAVTAETAQISQLVEPGEERLTGLGVRFFLEGTERLTEGKLRASVTDLTLNQVLCEADIAAEQFISGEFVGLLFENSQEGVSDHRYRIDLEFSPELWNSGLMLMTSEEGICVNAYLYFNIFLKKFFFFMFLGTELFVCLFWYLVFVKRARIEQVFLVTILFLGLIYNVMLTPGMVPDEEKHMDMAYRYSNELLGYESLGDTRCLMRAEDADLEFTSSPSLSNYRNVYYGLFSRAEDERMVEAEVSSNLEGSRLLYAPAVAGMSLARLLGLGPVPMLLLARYLNLLAFALLTWAGMKRLPFGRVTLFLLAILPVNMQQCTSFSHDAMVHGILFFYSCLCLEAIFSQKRMTGQQMVLLGLAGWSLVYCKGGSYLPLTFLPILIPAAAFGGKKEKWQGAGALLGIPVLAFLMKQLRMVTGMVTATAATSVVSNGAGTEYMTGYTLGYFLKEPLEFIYMMVNTLLDKTGFYLESLIGYKLGWVEIETSMVVVFLFWFLLFLSICQCRGEERKLGGFPRFWMLFLCLGCTGLILLGMLLSWTPMGHVSVEGVQGRYFLPFMLIFLTACRNRIILISRNLDRAILSAAAAGQLLTLVYLIRQVLTV